MPNPFSILWPALEVLATEGRVLSAKGQTVEDQATPDIEEIYDRVTGGKAEVRSIWAHIPHLNNANLRILGYPSSQETLARRGADERGDV